MFDNAITLSPSGVSVSIKDTDDGKTVRTYNLGGGNRIDVTISHTESTENKGVLSDRYLIRVDRILTEPTSPYAPTKLSSYIVQVVPRRPDVTVELIKVNLADCINLLPVVGGDTVVAASQIDNGLTRLLAGET